MRIALLPSAYAPSVGGVEILTSRLAHHLRAGGDEVEVWTLRHPPDLPEEEWVEGVRVRRFSLPVPPARLEPLLRFPREASAGLRALLAARRAFRPDVLHVQCFSANGVYAALLAGIVRLPLVVSLQGEAVMDDNDVFDESVGMRLGLRLALRKADAVTGCSAFVLNDAVRFGLRPGSGRVVFNGVDEPAGEELTALDVPFPTFVLALGRVVRKKGFDLLLKAWPKVTAVHPDVGLVVAGGGQELEALHRLAGQLDVSHSVCFSGSVDRPRVEWLMRNADVFVLPSRVEPFGIVVLEALRAGVPVVVSSRGGAGEIVTHGKEGLVVDPLDTEALAAAIVSLLGDENLRTTLASAGPERVGEFTWPRIVDEYRSLYLSVVPG